MLTKAFYVSLICLNAAITCCPADMKGSNGSNLAKSHLIQFTSDSKVGFVDSSGQIVITPRFADAGDFSEGLASFSQAGRAGYINVNGDVVIPPLFDEVRPFSEGVAAVRVGRNWSFANAAGELTSKAQYQAIGGMHNGLARVASWSQFVCGGGTQTIPNDQADDDAFVFSDERPTAGDCQPDQMMVGYINSEGMVVVPLQYSIAYDFTADGLAKVVTTDGQVGYIDQSGSFAIRPVFLDGSEFSEGLAAVKMGDGWTFLNQSGNPLTELRYERARAFSEGLAVVWDADSGKCGYVDHSGTPAIAFQYDRCGDFSGAHAFVVVENNTDTPEVFPINPDGSPVPSTALPPVAARN